MFLHEYRDDEYKKRKLKTTREKREKTRETHARKNTLRKWVRNTLRTLAKVHTHTTLHYTTLHTNEE